MNAFKIVEKMVAKGFTRDQAEVSLEAWAEFMNENLASKSDLFALKSDLKEVVHKMEQMENRIIIKLGGIVIAAISIMGIVLGIIIKIN